VKTTTCLVLLGLLLAAPVLADEPPFQDELLDSFVGTWVLRGTIAGGEVVHDVTAAWVLGHQYLSFHEVSREKTPEGALAYEATVYIGWDDATSRYTCLWLDSTGHTGLGNGIIGRASRKLDELAFVFGEGGDGTFHTTFLHDEKTDSWKWTMDAKKDGKLRSFARMAMTKQ
jgi:hypothetical protein